MEWLFDPAIWIGLLTLVVLEVVLGIDNLVFIAILADKLPPKERNHARLTGLLLAMVMRLGMLSLLSWMVTLTRPLFTIYTVSLSGRDLILLIGGVFLLFKATMELHERLEGRPHHDDESKVFPSFWVVVTQIVILDAIFSLDSVITAVGIVNHLPVMMAAVIIAVAIMVWASRPLTEFVAKHPTVVVLCLSFLLMIGLSLIAESVGFHIPKGYLYACIGFSILIEMFNQIAQHNFMKHMAQIPLRDRTADAVLRLLGGKSRTEPRELEPEEKTVIAEEPVFGEEERNMVTGVLTLGERSIRSIMTPRNDVTWVDLDDCAETIQEQLRHTPHSFFPVCRGKLDNVLGVARAQDLMDDLHTYGKINTESSLREAIVMPESAGVLQAMDIFKTSRGQIALVADEYGTIEGLLTPIDILEAIAGEFPDEDEQPSVMEIEDGVWEIEGATDLYTAEQVLGTDGLVDDDQEYSSINGFLLERFGTVPHVGQSFDYNGYRFEVTEMDGRRIVKVRVSRIEKPHAGDE